LRALGGTARITIMQALKWIVLTLALFQGGWLIFDGSRALIVGDYLTPASGPHARQLGPWSRVVSAAGFEPRSTFIKCVHLLLGIAWLIALVVLAARPVLGRWIALGCGVGTLWYLPMGTIIGTIIIVILLAPKKHRCLI
jgi:hypothetical protein